MTDVRRSRIFKRMDELFFPDYDAQNMPSADKRAAYALEHIAFPMGRIDEKLERLLGAVESLTAKPNK